MGKINKIVYLFGAGATEAELRVAKRIPNPTPPILTNEAISKAIIQNAMKIKEIRELQGIKNIVRPSEIKDIELVISLLETQNSEDSFFLAENLRGLFSDYVISKLKISNNRFIEPQLTKHLFKMHKHPKVKQKERIIACLTLNYDRLIDRAHNCIFGQDSIDYGFGSRSETSPSFPVLKLHGAFTWEKTGPGQVVPRKSYLHKPVYSWIPPGLSKSNSSYPYNLIWGKATQILQECNTLRVIGCSLSQNDITLISTLFNTQFSRGKPYTIELIDFKGPCSDISERLAIIPRIESLGRIEDGSYSHLASATENPYLDWIRTKHEKMIGKKLVVNKV